MRRFFAGLLADLLAGAIAWFFSDGNLALTIFVGLLVALIIWFTRLADEISGVALEFGGAILRGLDKLF